MDHSVVRPSNKKVAILVLAFRAPTVLESCVSLFPSVHFHFYVHVDQKASIEEFKFLSDRPNITVISDRFTIFWGGFNMMLAELSLLRHASSDGQCQTFILISDDSFPLRSSEEIRAAVSANSNWLDQHKVADGTAMNRYQGYYYFDSMATDPQFRPPESRNIGLPQIRDIQSLESLLTKGKKVLNQLYQGSQWWCLSSELCSYLLGVVDQDTHLRESFRFSAVPDEHYIQTVIGNSGVNWSLRPTHMYFDFSQNPKPFVFSDMEQLEKPFSSDRLFVRKVASDRLLLEALVKRITK